MGQKIYSDNAEVKFEKINLRPKDFRKNGEGGISLIYKNFSPEYENNIGIEDAGCYDELMGSRLNFHVSPELISEIVNNIPALAKMNLDLSGVKYDKNQAHMAILPKDNFPEFEDKAIMIMISRKAYDSMAEFIQEQANDYEDKCFLPLSLFYTKPE